MPTPSFIGSTFNNAGGSPLYLDAPSGTAAGDLLVLVGVQYNSNAALTPKGTGWTEVTGTGLQTLSNGTGISAVFMRIFTKIATTADIGSNNCYLTGGGTIVGGLYVFRDAAQPTTTANGVLSSAYNSGQETAPAVTTTVDGSRVLHVLGMTASTSGGTKTLTFGGSGGTNTGSTQYFNGSTILMLQDIAVPTAGAAAQPTAGTTSNHQYANVALLIAPPPSPNASITGVAATMTVAAPVGTVLATGTDVEVTGTTSTATTGAPAGSVSTSANITGATALVTTAAPPGSLSTNSNVLLSGVAATAAAGAPAGTVHAETSLTTWTVEDSQRLNVDVQLFGTLTVDVTPVDPPAGLETDGPDIIHFDFDDTLVLDGNGRPS